MNTTQQNIKDKNVTTIEEICEIFRDRDKLTNSEVSDIIKEYRSFNYTFDNFLDNITFTSLRYTGEKEKQKYLNSILNLINEKILKRKFNKCINDINIKLSNLEISNENYPTIEKVLDILKQK